MLAALILYQLVTAVFAGYEVPTITCVCSTTHCIEHQMFRCNTTGMCFSQYLDRRDGSHPVVRGCISSKTPLLCENRRPAIAGGSWPVLLCCDSNLCNMDAVPTPLPPSQVQTEQSGNGPEENSLNSFNLKESSMDGGTTLDSSDDLDSKSNHRNSRTSSFPKIVSPVYITVSVLGVIALVFIGIIAAIIVKRNNKFYADQYGALERIEEYSKPSVDIEASTCLHASHAHHHYVYREKDFPKT